MKKILALILTWLLFAAPTVVTAADGILGKWTTDEGKSHVVISKCDAGLCGKVTWLKEPNYPADDDNGMAGKPKIDRENPDPTKQGNSIIGLEVLKGFKTNNDNVWENGTCYDTENGKTYKCKVTLVDPNTLKVRGFIGFSWIGRTTVWTR